jgi:Leucine-rich repeat (LRR) protein
MLPYFRQLNEKHYTVYRSKFPLKSKYENMKNIKLPLFPVFIAWCKSFPAFGFCFVLFLIVYPFAGSTQTPLLTQEELASKKVYTTIEEAITATESVYRLDLSRKDTKATPLKVVPADLFKLTTLQELNLSNQELKAIPAEIYNLKNLQKLDLSFNLISEIPIGISNLKHLTILSFRFNRLSELPLELCTLTSLQELDLFACRVKTLPPCVNKLKSLRKLNMQRNGLTTEEKEVIRKTLPGVTIE